jgi:hypothetical protein
VFTVTVRGALTQVKRSGFFASRRRSLADARELLD